MLFACISSDYSLLVFSLICLNPYFSTFSSQGHTCHLSLISTEKRKRMNTLRNVSVFALFSSRRFCSSALARSLRTFGRFFYLHLCLLKLFVKKKKKTVLAYIFQILKLDSDLKLTIDHCNIPPDLYLWKWSLDSLWSNSSPAITLLNNLNFYLSYFLVSVGLLSRYKWGLFGFELDSSEQNLIVFLHDSGYLLI